MAESQISRVEIPCLVIQLNNQQFITDDNIFGQVRLVPCKDSLIDEVLYWGVPVKNTGMFTTIQWILRNGSDYDQPTFDSFLVQRVRDKLTNYTWWIYVENGNNFKNSCNTCCGADVVPMPGVDGSFMPQIAPCQQVCDIVNGGGQYQAIFGLPVLPVGQKYFPYGSYNNVKLFSNASGSGYSTISALLSYMNANSVNIGSPAVTITWTASGDGLTLIGTGFNKYDEICVVVESIVPSP